MLKLLNGLFIIMSVGLVMAAVFLGGQGQAHGQPFLEAITERWYLLAGFVVTAFLALMTRGRKRPAYDD